MRLKCALLGLGVLKVALHKAKGTPLPEEWGTATRSRSPSDACPVEVCPLDGAAAGTSGSSGGPAHDRRLPLRRQLYAIEDRCSHDDGPLCEGEWERRTVLAICPRHGARFDIRTGLPLTLPAYLPVDTFPVRTRDDGMVVVDLP